MENKIYTTLSIPIESKDKFLQMNIEWNIKHKKQRKTKEEFFQLLMNKFKEIEKE